MAKPKINLMPMLAQMAKHEKPESKAVEKKEEKSMKGGKKKGKGC